MEITQIVKTGPENKGFIPFINLSELPSKFLAYPTNARIKYRPYSVGEVKEFSTGNLSIKDSFEKVLEGVECNFDKLDLTLFDVSFISVLRKISSLGSTKFTITGYCSKCKKETATATLTPEDLSFKDLEIPKLPIVVKLAEEEIVLKFSPLTIGQFLKMDLDQKEDDLYSLACQIMNYPIEEAVTVIKSLSNARILSLNKVDNYLHHGLEPIPLTCSECKHIELLETEGGEFMLSPFFGSGEFDEECISFGD